MAMKRFKKAENQLFDQVQEAVAYIHGQSDFKPEAAIILGTGLGNLVHKIKCEKAIEYASIPHFPVSTVESHAGRLMLGELAGRKVVAMEGRFHFYEGYGLDEVTFPVRVMKALGARFLLVSNAAGGMNLSYKKGDLAIIDDHINFMGVNPLVGPNDERFGSRFPDMCEPYTESLKKIAETEAKKLGIPTHRAVYVGVTGPCLETKAEYRMMRNLGADLVGMSTVPEVIVGVHMGMQVLGLSVVTDLCDPDHLEPVDIKEIIKTANEAGPKMDRLIEAVVKNLEK